MTHDEADAIIAELNICFPSKQLLVEEVKRWENNLSEFNFDDAKKAVKRIEDTCKFWPAWAEFREAILPLHKQRQWEEKEKREREQKALEAPRTPEEAARVAEIIAEIRRNLSKRA